jgi:hypothetical protein
MPLMTNLAQPSQVSPSLAELQAQVAEFRSTHPPQSRMPPSLWKSAADLARCHGLAVVARSLKLNYCTLKKHVSNPESARLGRKAQTKFVELIGATRESADEYLIEFESAAGGKLRIHCKTATPPDWGALLHAWRRVEP